VPVDAGQAGGHVVCECGKKLEVPTLRRLRHLPLEEQAAAKTRTAWRPKFGAVAAFLIPAVLLTAVSVGLRISEPKVLPVNLTGAHEYVLERIDQMTPAEWWQWWTYRYRPDTLQGFTVLENQLPPEQAQQVAKKRLVQNVLLSLAALFAGAGMVAALWPTGAKTKAR
jgi:hypothetical protein